MTLGAEDVDEHRGGRRRAAQRPHVPKRDRGQSAEARANATYASAPRLEDMRFTQVGLFAEATHTLRRRSRLVGGARATGTRPSTAGRASGRRCAPASSPLKNDTRGATDRKTLASGFARFEHDLGRAGLSGRFSAGVGHVERFPDYWERLKQDPATLKSAFLSTRPEKTTQLDAGVVWTGGAWSGSVSAFCGTIRDYVLIRWKPTPTVTRNVDATTPAPRRTSPTASPGT